jgi:excisionase family DNA binding protein
MQTERVCLTVKEVAAMLGVSKNSCYEACRRGEIPHLRIGKRILVSRVVLCRLLDNHVRESNATVGNCEERNE